jgi:hypothetical protein
MKLASFFVRPGSSVAPGTFWAQFGDEVLL